MMVREPKILSANIPSETPRYTAVLSTTPKTAGIRPGSPLHGLLRAEEVYQFYDKDARTTIGKAIQSEGGSAIWNLILRALDAGFLVRTNSVGVNLGLLFPRAERAYRQKFNLLDPDDREKVLDIILPAAIENRNEVLAHPARLEKIVNAYAKKQAVANREAAKQRQLDAKLKAMPANETEIVMYGDRLWPCTNGQSYTYDQVRCAIWFFDDYLRALSEVCYPTPCDKAIAARFSVKWFLEFTSRLETDTGELRRVFQLIQHLAGLLQQNSQGECRRPPYPHQEGQW
jgi:hypothetical protein